MKLSVIICVYNTDRMYLDEALRSITDSTLKQSEYEICIVDDGSSADYSDIIKKYSAKYKKAENRGIFSARLTGIEMAEGDYVAFVDSDDTVSFNYHLPMVKEAEQSGSDIVFNSWAFHTERSRYYCAADSTINSRVGAEEDETLLLFTRKQGREHSYYVLWNKIFRADILKRVRDELLPIAERRERFNYGEDALMCYFAFKFARRISSVRTGYYFYRIHSSQSVNVISDKRLESQVRCMSEVFSIMLENIGKNEFKEEIKENILQWRKMISRAHYSHAKANNYCHLYQLIKKAYSTDALRTATYKDGKAYTNNKLIPDNFTEIDSSLLKIYRDRSICSVKLCRPDKYILAAIEMIKADSRELTRSPEGYPIPAPKRRLINAILINPVVYSIGLLLFKKGGRIRKFLKKHL